jgi:hypothetical protein
VELRTRLVRVFGLIVALLCVTRLYAGDGFESVRCGSDIRKALIGRKTSNERVVVIEARHKDLGLKDLGAEEISDSLNLVFWLICGEEYAVLEDGDVVRDALKIPKHSKESPEFVGSCQLNGKDLPDYAVGVAKDEAGAETLPVVSAWKIDEKQKKFVELKTEGLRCSRDGISSADGGR